MKRLIALLIAMFLCLPLAACDGGYSRGGVVLGEAIVLKVNARGGNSKAAVEEMFALADEVFAEMDLSDESSALSRFNASSSLDRFEIDVHTFRVLELAEKVYELSGGAFDVTAFPLSRLWGVDTAGLHGSRPDMLDPVGTAKKRLPTYESVVSTLAHVGMDKLSFFEDGGKYYIAKSDPLTEVDLGGIAKGYFADLCVEIAGKYGVESCLIDLSGNICLVGGGIKSGGDWSVGIANPRPRLAIEEFRGYVAAVKCVGDRSFVTSGDYQRFYYYDDGGANDESELIAVCHIIDPRSGLPVGIRYDEGADRFLKDETAGIMSVVRGKNSAMCDALSTAATVLGAEKGALLLKEAEADGLIFAGGEGEKGRLAVVGEWEFMDGYETYRTDYDEVSA